MKSIFARLDGESHNARLRRLLASGITRAEIVDRGVGSAAELDAICPPLRAGRRCWLRPVGFVTLLRRTVDETGWWAMNKHGEEVFVTEAEIEPLGVAA